MTIGASEEREWYVGPDGEAEVMPGYTTQDAICLDLQNLATWLEQLPAHAMLCFSKHQDQVLVPDPHRTAMHLRLALPAESRA